MGKLRKVSHKDVPLVSSFESADSIREPFVPNDFAEDGSYPLSTELSGDEGPFDKALFKFYINQKVKSLKRKLTSAGRRNVRQKRSTDYPTCLTFTRYSGKFFSGVVDDMCPRYKDVIQAYGMGCLLNFVSTEVPLRLVKWLACRFDVLASEFQLKKKFIPVTKYDIHNILDLPIDGERLFCDPELGRDFVLSHFNLSSIPPVSFFANKLKSSEVELCDDDIFICFMIVAFSSFLCPNSSLSPSPKYLHIFRDCHSVCKLDLSQFVYEWLLSSIKKFKDSSKVASKRSVTFGGCHYAFAVSYHDHLNFGLHSVPDVKPRLLSWRGNKVKQFAELDRNNSRSYGKRPLKPFCPSVRLQESVDKSTTSKDVELHPPNGLFAVTVQNSFGPRFGLETTQELMDLIQDRNKDKPKIFIDWSESLIIDVLDCLSRCPLHANTGPTTKVSGSEDNSQNKFSFGHKSVSIQSVIPERTCAKIDDIPSNEVHVEFQIVDQATTPAAGVVIDGDIQNPVLISSAITPPKTVVNQDAVPSFPIFGEANAEASASMHMFLAKAVSSHGICPPSTDCGIPVFDSSLLESAGPFKKCEAKSHVCDFQIPSVAALNQSFGIDDVKHAMKDARYFRPLSPLVPIRLSHLFQNELGDVECSQYVAEKFKKSMETPAVEDCVYTVTLPDPKISKSANSSRRCTADLCSPIVSKETSNVSSKVNQPEDDVQIVGTSSFVVRCQDLSSSLDATYNKMKNFSSSAPMSHNAKMPQAASSLEVEFVSERVACPSMAAPKAPASNAPTATFIFPSGSAASSSGTHATRRIVYPGRYNSEPYVAPQINRFVPTQLERRHYLAMTEIGKHEIWCKFEAIRYDKAYCSYRSRATLKSREHVDNFLILCVCRFLFIQCHPSVSKKHFFFSYIGENILDGSNPAIVGNAFAGANRAFPMWRSDCLFFPIGRDNHWFSFVVCLKEKKFAFLDSFYDANSYFHTSIRDDLVNNFVNLWDEFVTPILRKRIVFESFDYVYPAVPQQNNSDDCGVFTSMYLKHWSPRSPIGNMFGAADIDNIRVKLANELFFSTNNTADKTLVTNFFGDAQV